MRVTEHAAGNFCWAELNTNDAAGAKAFYTSLFGWTFDDNPMGPDMVYTMLFKEGGSVAALYQEQGSQMPPHWGAYISSSDADATAAKANQAGGTVMMEPFDVMTFGRMCVLQDPTGAVLSVWQPKDHIGYQIVDEPGAVCWNELNTRGGDRARPFYEAVFGWKSKESSMGGGYVEFENNGKTVAGLMEITPEMGDHIPPHWLTYFQVANTDASADKAMALGGQVLFGPENIPDMGRFAVVQDPQGAVFGIYSAG